ncbi:MAG: bifunctional folylpolyglutamate synthase/dihydrofolate synthase [Alphaproteobacteria bacterium]|nr:bifunctional folylpolyglutamate synthase/dihydrofolate synthase [Alphaproteobacteria bacterium]
MTGSSAAILERFRRGSSRDIDLTLRKPYLDLLDKLGNPHLNLPPVIHVAGTNGKGSTCAFLRAMAESAGFKAHVYTSPHLVTFHERIRIAGRLIEDDELADILHACERRTERGDITFFEAGTIAAFVAFARHPADVAILEVGLGGRLDATNVIPHPAATVITRLSFDHRDYLGDTMAGIAREKAGIMRPRTPCFTAHQPSAEALAALRQVAAKRDVPLYVGGEDWRVEEPDEGTFRFTGAHRSITLPLPALTGRHQINNAGLAIAASEAFPFAVSDEALRLAMRRVEWPARLQRLKQGRLAALLPAEWELWLDGGHNDSAGEALAEQLKAWRAEDGASPRPLFVIVGMLSTKAPPEFAGPLMPYADSWRTVPIEGEPLGLAAKDLSEILKKAGIENITPSSNLAEAITNLVQSGAPAARLLVCGSLYLAGNALKQNGQMS